jgi:hypothetical protein
MHPDQAREMGVRLDATGYDNHTAHVNYLDGLSRRVIVADRRDPLALNRNRPLGSTLRRHDVAATD